MADTSGPEARGPAGDAADGMWEHVFRHVAWGVGISSGDGPLLNFANPAFAQMHGYSPEEMQGMAIAGLFPPERRGEVAGHIRNGIRRDRYVFESEHLRKDGSAFPVLVDITAVRDPAGAVLYRVVNVQDITERKEAEAALRRGAAIMDAVRYAAQSFLRPSGSWEAQVQRVIARLGQAAGVSRVYVFENQQAPGGRLLADQRFEWVAPGITPQIDHPGRQKIPWDVPGFDRWGALLAQRRPYHDHVRNLPPAEQELLAGMDILSFVIVPVFAGEEWWGFVGFDECAAEREWSTAEIDALQAAAHTLGIAVEHRRDDRSLHEALAQREAAVEALRASEARLEQRVEERTREIERRSRVAEGMREILRTLNSARPLEDALDQIVDQACAQLDTGIAAVYRVSPDFREFAAQAARGKALPLGGRFVAGATEGLIEVADGFRPFVITDFAGKAAAYLHPAAPPPGEPSVQTVLMAPLLVKQHFYGVLAVGYEAPREVGPEDLALAVALAHQAALAIENARLHAQAQELAALAERQKLARDLHDSVSQAMYGILLAAGTARTLLDSDPARAAKPLDYVLELAEAGLAEMRALIFELLPDGFESEGLAAALARQASLLQARHHIAVHADLCDEPELPTGAKEALYRAGQEALHNVIKHSGARAAHLVLRHDAPWVTLEIRDDGRGFDPHGSYPGHLGLRSMRERAEQFGGSVLVESAPGRGARVVVRVPDRS